MNYSDRKIIIVKEDSDLDKVIEFIRNNENKIIKKQFFLDTLEQFEQFAFDIDTGDIVCAVEYETGNLLVTGNVVIK